MGIIGFLYRVDVNDIGMIQGRERFGLSLKALQSLLAGSKLGRQYLQRYLPLEGRILGPIHLSHAALAELLQDLVVAERLANHGPPRNASILLLRQRAECHPGG